jgi:hypothetical protein
LAECGRLECEFPSVLQYKPKPWRRWKRRRAA